MVAGNGFPDNKVHRRAPVNAEEDASVARVKGVPIAAIESRLWDGGGRYGWDKVGMPQVQI